MISFIQKLDPRTYLVFLLLMSIFLMLTTNETQVVALTLLGAIVLASSGYPIKSLLYVLLYVLLAGLGQLLEHSGFGTFVVIFDTFSQMVPLAMIAAALMSKPASAVLAAFERLRLPKNLIVIICVLLRFFPVLLKEMSSIIEGMAARNVFGSAYRALVKPRLAYECFLVPLLVRCLKLSSELSASAVLRGIESGNRRTSIFSFGLGGRDIVAVFLFSGVAIAMKSWI